MITAEEVRQSMIPSINLILNTIELQIMSAKNLGYVSTKYEVPPRAVPHIDGIVKTLKDSGFRVTVDTVVDRGSDYFDILIGW